MPVPNANTRSAGGEAIKQWMLLQSDSQKKDESWGKSIAQYIGTTTFASVGSGYFWNRNTRFKQNRDMAGGRDFPAKFMDMLQMNGKFNYVNINWQASKIVNTIISKLVGRWMGRNEKIVVTATDTLSTNDKIENYRQAEFVMLHKQQLDEISQQSGVQMTSPDQFVPQDRDELDLWMAEYQRIPEEILYEKGTNDVLWANGLFDVIKEKLLWDSASVGLVGTETWMDSEGVIKSEWVKPENTFYSYSEFPDFRDTTWRGRVKALKISEIRKQYGQQFGGKLTEEQLFQIAQTCKEYQLPDKLRWMTEWNTSVIRPYDEWNADAMVFEIKTVDSDPYTLVTTKKNKSTFFKKGVPKQNSDSEQFVEDTHINIYRGVYLRINDILLEWGLKKNMIRPQDPKESGNAEFSFSFYMYQNNDMRNVAVPEKIQRPVEGMVLAVYKMQQVIIRMRPTGAAINVDAMKEISYGLGDKDKLIDPKKFYDQTGDIYYRGRDAAGNQIPVPIQELANAGFLGQMDGLIKNYEFNYKILKDELGEDPSLVTQAAQPRVAVENIQASMQAADNATDHIYDAYLYVMEDTAKKISCLLHDSVTFGAEAYRHIMNEEDIKGRMFGTRIQMLPTQQEMARLEGFLNQSIQSNPELVMFVDPSKVMRLAKEDVKLAEWYLRQCQKKMWSAQQAQATKNSQEQAQAAQQAAQIKAQSDQQLIAFKAQADQSSQQELSKAQKEQILLQGLMDLYKGGILQPTPQLLQLGSEIMINVALPLFAENQNNARAIAQADQMHQAASQQEQAQQAQGGPPPDQGQPDQGQPQEQQQQIPSQTQPQ